MKLTLVLHVQFKHAAEKETSPTNNSGFVSFSNLSSDSQFHLSQPPQSGPSHSEYEYAEPEPGLASSDLSLSDINAYTVVGNDLVLQVSFHDSAQD